MSREYTSFFEGARSVILNAWRQGLYVNHSSLGYETRGGKYNYVAWKIHEAFDEMWTIVRDHPNGLRSAYHRRQELQLLKKKIKKLEASRKFAYDQLNNNEYYHNAASKISGFKRMIDAKKDKAYLAKRAGVRELLDNIMENTGLDESTKLRYANELRLKYDEIPEPRSERLWFY